MLIISNDQEMDHFLNVHFVLVFAFPVTSNIEYCICVYLSIVVFILYYTGRYQKAFQSVSSQLVDTAYFMSDVQNWKCLLMAPKRRGYGKGPRRAGRRTSYGICAKVIVHVHIYLHSTYVCMCICRGEEYVIL